MSYRLIDANALNNKISTEDYEIIMKEPEVFADLPNGLDGGFYIAVPAHEGMTNGDMIKALFPDVKVEGHNKDVHGNSHLYCVDELDGVTHFTADWWNAPYKRTEG